MEFKQDKALHWCPHCKENSVRRKTYTRKRDGAKRRFEHCINKGCSYKLDLPLPEDINVMVTTGV